jgi:hypothetical protein
MASQEDLPRALDVERFAEARQAEVNCLYTVKCFCCFSRVWDAHAVLSTAARSIFNMQIQNLEATVKESGPAWVMEALPRHLRR